MTVNLVRGIFTNRTLNLRSIKAIGYDMDYTLIHYRTRDLEAQAFEITRRRLLDAGWPVEGLAFDPDSVTRGLAIDLELGNLVKATRFGYIIRAAHGTRMLSYDELRSAYAGELVDLADSRYGFMNTLYSVSEGNLFGQLVDLFDADRLPGVRSYGELAEVVGRALDRTHMDGTLKAEIYADPARYMVPDPEVVQAVVDQRAAGKDLLLITNSDWEYARRMMELAFDPYLPGDMTWRSLFQTIIVSAGKPGFFAGDYHFLRVVDEERALLEPHRGPLAEGTVYYGGNAQLLERSLGLSGDEILYVGDHLFGDVHVSKSMFRWRTALILRELEAELLAMTAFRETEEKLTALMAEKSDLERRRARLRLDLLRLEQHAATDVPEPDAGELLDLQSLIAALDDQIAPLAQASGELGNLLWGPIMRAGNDKSLFARQVERYADVYTSRAANFLHETPFAFLRAPRGSLPHDHYDR
ncbi:MAG: HAD-IG family 5'-nucleotidase [Acidimicrobiia bacterium]|nr:HAD-IG family 5'-nucleotidase [Acidimicrobiia bacterium]NNL69968.1 HAD-IG family 5'-nucleotidase [Acidimicrobiia bacterium]